MKELPVPSHLRPLIMTEHHTLTIGDACTKHGVNRSTLTLWVKNGKVVSEKRMIGRKSIYFINEKSLLEQMESSKATTTKPAEEPNQPLKTKGTPEPNSDPDGKPEQDPEEAQKPDSESGKNPAPRKRPRSNVAVSRAKGAMRSLDQNELIRVNIWLAKRIIAKSKPPW